MNYSHVEVGKFFFVNENYEKAIEEFNKAIQEEPSSAEPYYNLGIVYEARNDLEEAKQSYQKALEINPDHKKSEEHLAKLVGI
jgi:Flp pilus assembly protein TadD